MVLALCGCVAPDAHDPLFVQKRFAPFSRASAVAVAEREWRLWGMRVDDDGDAGYVQSDATMAERQPGLWQRVGEYWWEGLNAGAPQAGWTGLTDGTGQVFPVAVNGDYAWSAAFISYVMRVAGAGPKFPYAPDHSFYIDYAARAALGDVKDPLLVAEDPAVYAPAVGDLLCYGRGRGRDLRFDDLPTGYSFPGHCSIIVAVRPGALSEVGGNVEDAVALTNVKLDARGVVSDRAETWLTVLRVMYAD